MKSSVRKIRDVVLLLLFVVLYFHADAFNLGIFFNSRDDSSYKLTTTNVRQDKVGYNTRDIKNATPNIELTLTPLLTSIAQLSWTSTDYTVPGTYYVERLDPTGWTVLKQLPYDTLRVYNDTISYPYCSSTNITYQIRFISAIDNITSTPKSASFSDKTSPAEVKNLNVDLVVTPGGFLPRITWNENTTDSVFKYDIQRYDGSSWPIIGSAAPDSGGFNDQIAFSPCDQSYRYVVLAYDKCGNNSGEKLYDDIAVQTIKLDIAAPVQCDKSATLTWNSNDHMPGGISGFEIYRSDGGPAVVIDTVAATVTTYLDKFNYINGISYGYSVKAFSNNSSYTSSSCQVFQQFNSSIEPDTVYVTQVTVEEDSYIRVGCYFSPGSSVVRLILERSEDNGTNFHAVDSIMVAGLTNQYFSDSNVDVHAHSYSYRVIAVDDCGNRKTSKNISRSIYIQCTQLPAQNSLDWNSYESWLRGVEGYDVYRILDGQSVSVELLGNVGQWTFSYSDLLSSFDQSKLPCYWVVAKENAGNPIAQNVTSTSNTCCVLKDPVLYMPNAFYPEGKNKLFRPVPSPLYVDEQTFKMTIFSRWGQQIFETTNMVNGWDGMVNGQYTPSGLYSYILTYSSLEGKGYTKRGTVTLIR